MTLIRSVGEIKAMYLEKSDSLDASSYEVVDLCDEVERLRAIVDRLYHACDAEMADETQGPSETLANVWARIEEAAKQTARGHAT